VNERDNKIDLSEHLFYHST